eukprot:Opistho-2@14240
MTFGFVTIREGDKGIIVDRRNGKVELVEGPSRRFLFRADYTPLRRFFADQKEYLEVRHRNGIREHLAGPVSLYQNPIDHESIFVRNVITLDANEALVVYKQGGGENAVQRRIAYGPTLFVPQANEWLHEFSWHGSPDNDKTRKIPNALKFTKLRVIPDQFYYNVPDVRTSDDALLNAVKVMIFFELKDLEMMLVNTHDPIADFINALCADVIAFAATLTYEQFLEKTCMLNDLNTYSQLCSRSKRIGYNITKVVYRGYHSANLQGMHDTAIESRTRLRLEAETEAQSQTLADMKLSKQMERARMEQSMEVDASEHSLKIQAQQAAHDLRCDHEQHEERLRQKSAEAAKEIEHLRLKNAEQLAFLDSLRNMGVDLTSYLVSQHVHPDKVYKVVGSHGDAAATQANVHIHDTA